MSLTRKIGELLIALDNAVLTVFGDDAYLTNIMPSPSYEDDRTILDITITINKRNISNEDFDIKMSIFDELIYNSVFNYTEALTKVNLRLKEI